MKKFILCLIIITSLLAFAKLALIFFAPDQNQINYPILKKQLSRQNGKITVPILAYHHIRPGKAGDANSVAPEIFDEQMGWLKDNGYRLISYSQFYGYLTSSSAPPEKSAVLSFDDGYQDQYAAGLPVLKKYGYPAIFFLNYNAVNAWWRWDTMTWPMVKDLQANNLEIGSHGLDHKDLTKLSPARAIYEIRQGKLKLEYKLMAPVNYFAYPYGAYSPQIVEQVENAGFWSALTDGGGAVHDRAVGPFAISRINAENSLESFIKIFQK